MSNVHNFPSRTSYVITSYFDGGWEHYCAPRGFSVFDRSVGCPHCGLNNPVGDEPPPAKSAEEWAKHGCECPAPVGEKCPLTSAECEVRFRERQQKADQPPVEYQETTIFERDGKQWGTKDENGRLHFPADTPSEVLMDAMLKKIAFSMDVALKPHGEDLAKKDNARIDEKLRNKNRW